MEAWKIIFVLMTVVAVSYQSSPHCGRTPCRIGTRCYNVLDRNTGSVSAACLEISSVNITTRVCGGSPLLVRTPLGSYVEADCRSLLNPVPCPHNYRCTNVFLPTNIAGVCCPRHDD